MNQFENTAAALQAAIIEFHTGPFRSLSAVYANLTPIYDLRPSHRAAAALPARQLPATADPGPNLSRALIESWTRARRPRRRPGRAARAAVRHFYRGEFTRLNLAALWIDTAAALEDARLYPLIGRRGLALLNGFYAVAAIGVLHRAGQLTPDRLQWLERTADHAHRIVTEPRQPPPPGKPHVTPLWLSRAFRQLDQDITARNWPQSLTTAHRIIENYLDRTLPDAPPEGFHQKGNGFTRRIKADTAAALLDAPERLLVADLAGLPTVDPSARTFAQHLARAIQPGKDRHSPLSRLAHAAHTYRHTRDRDALPAAIHALVGAMETRWRDMQDC